MNKYRIIEGDCREGLKQIADNSVHTCITSPPYFGLRSYNGGQSEIGCENEVQQYVDAMVDVFREVRRALRPDGTLWLNLGDSYMAQYNVPPPPQTIGGQRDMPTTIPGNRKKQKGLKHKDLIGIPWRVAFALQADGWWLRQECIWCLSGGTCVYVRTKNSGECVMMIRDLYRLDPSTVQLWNGTSWTNLLGMSKSKRRGDELEIVLRSGERISCTPTHKFPTSDGLKDASELVIGDTLLSCTLPPPENPRDCFIDEDAAWFAGLYLAEGSRSGDTIQISGHSKENHRWSEIQRIAKKFGGTATISVDGNNQAIRVYGKVLNAILDEMIVGTTAYDKGFSPVVWRYSNRFLERMMDGYLSGDGCQTGNRWRLGFCRNYRLEQNIRTACARLGYTLTLNLSHASCGEKSFPSFRGELRKERSGHCNEKSRNEIVKINKARCREVYDLGVEDEPHLFALASGILTHNSKPNPMPESVMDRCTRAHEYIFMLTKKSHYYYDHEAIKEQAVGAPHAPGNKNRTQPEEKGSRDPALEPDRVWASDGRKNKRSVWTVNTKGYKGAHFAVYPKNLILPCVLAGTSAHGCCSKCGAPWEMDVNVGMSDYEKHGKHWGGDFGRNDSVPPERISGRQTRTAKGTVPSLKAAERTPKGWKPTCKCKDASVVPCTVLDPFTGSGTTAVVAMENGRDFVGCELNPEYIKLAEARIAEEVPSDLDDLME